MNVKLFDVNFFSLQLWLMMLVYPWGVWVLLQRLRHCTWVHFSCDTFPLIHHSCESELRGVAFSVFYHDSFVLVSALKCLWVQLSLWKKKKVVPVVASFISPSESIFVVVSPLLCYPHFSIHNVLQSISNHALSFSSHVSYLLHLRKCPTHSLSQSHF